MSFRRKKENLLMNILIILLPSLNAAMACYSLAGKDRTLQGSLVLTLTIF
jgi:hypothetical protein